MDVTRKFRGSARSTFCVGPSGTAAIRKSPPFALKAQRELGWRPRHVNVEHEIGV
jgi:hypothetical protein